MGEDSILAFFHNLQHSGYLLTFGWTMGKILRMRLTYPIKIILQLRIAFKFNSFTAIISKVISLGI